MYDMLGLCSLGIRYVMMLWCVFANGRWCFCGLGQASVVVGFSAHSVLRYGNALVELARCPAVLVFYCHSYDPLDRDLWLRIPVCVV